MTSEPRLTAGCHARSSSGPLDYFGESDLFRRDVGLNRDLPLTPDSPGTDTQPAFSHDGNLIAFCSLRDDAAENGGIYVMARDGTGVRPLSPEGYNPAWSPDDSEIVYASIHTMASPFVNGGDGSALRVVNVTTGARRTIRDRAAAQPHWSPHGYRIAYWAAGAISTCRPDGSDVQEVVPGGRGADSYSWNPVWSPDGEFLYFSSNRNGVVHLWRVRIDEHSGRAIEAPEPGLPRPTPVAERSQGVRLGSDRGQTGVRLESDPSLTPV